MIVLQFEVVVACSQRDSPGLNVVLITVDTLRPDHLSAYGYARGTSAPLDWLAEEGVVFTNVYSTSSWTPPSVASLLTSLPPDRHGIRSGDAPDFLEGGHEVEGQEVLRGSVVTLAEAVAAHGYTTVGFSTNPHVSARLGFAQGFDHFESLRAPASSDTSAGAVYADAAAVASAVTRRTREAIAAGKAFIWIHYLDPHFPYRKRSPWLEEYAESDARDGPLPAAITHPRWFHESTADPAARRRLFEAWYDGEIRFACKEIGALLEELVDREQTLIVLTSDHGESIFEHGVLGHGQTLFEAELRIPLMLRFPEAWNATGTRSERVSIMDIAPTILSALAIPIPESMSGQSLMPLVREDARFESRALYSELRRGRLDVHAVIEDGWKLIVDRGRRFQALYHLDEDPGESRNLIHVRPGRARRLGQALMARVREADAARAAHREPIDEETRVRLRALGYVE